MQGSMEKKMTKGFHQILKERMEKAKTEGKLQPIKLPADKVRPTIKNDKLKVMLEKAKAEGKVRPTRETQMIGRMADIINKLKDRRNK